LFYQFIEGVSQHHRNVDELLGKVNSNMLSFFLVLLRNVKALETILKEHVAGSFSHRLSRTSQPSQVAQMITNLEHFEYACPELERSLTALRATQRGGTIRITSGAAAFADVLVKARARVTEVIASKLDDFFGLSEYDWTPTMKNDMPSGYLTELVAWLTTVVDSLVMRDEDKQEAYRGAVTYIAQCLMVIRIAISCSFTQRHVGFPHG
jgi:exocyst complex component 6